MSASRPPRKRPGFSAPSEGPGAGSSTAPPEPVLAAFGVTARPRRLTGGKGGAWRAGDVVLKPAEGEAETRWRSEVLAALPPDPRFGRRGRSGGPAATGWPAAGRPPRR